MPTASLSMGYKVCPFLINLTRSPCFTDYRHIPPKEISDLAVNKNFAEHAVDVAERLVSAFSHFHAQNLPYSPWELRPVGAFDQLAHLRVRVPELIVIGFHLPSEFTLYYKRKGESYTNTILRFDIGIEHQCRVKQVLLLGRLT